MAPLPANSRIPNSFGWVYIRRRAGEVAVHSAMALAMVAAITLFCYRLIHVNDTTAGFAYLVGVLLIATAWGLQGAAVASVASMLAFNYYFLPPIGTFTIADPQNWVALFAFLATSITAGQLSEHAKRHTREAAEREREMERLYTLSRAILLTDPKQPVAKLIARQIAHIFELSAVALYERSSGEIHRGGPEDMQDIDAKLRESAVDGTQFRDESIGLVVTAIQLGGEPVGSLAIVGAHLPDNALQALSNLVAIALERAQGQEAANRAEAVRQSEEFKSTLLDAVAHEFKTPLTSIKAATTSLLLDFNQASENQRELMAIVDEEVEHLNRLVNDASQVARVESGKLHLNYERHSASAMIDAALSPLKSMMEGREVRIQINKDLPFVSVDHELIKLAIRHLVDNALKYSTPNTPITISAEAVEDQLVICVADQGPGIPENEQSKIFEKFHRGAADYGRTAGTGMGLTIALEIARAHGGNITLKSKLGKGSRFCLVFPAKLAESKA